MREFWLGEENFPQQNIFPDKIFPNKVFVFVKMFPDKVIVFPKSVVTPSKKMHCYQFLCKDLKAYP